jgi:hypothetical protein
MCYARGFIYEEDAWGRPLGQMPCPYCHGTRDNSWEKEQAWQEQQKRDKNKGIRVGVLVGAVCLSVMGWQHDWNGWGAVVWFLGLVVAYCALRYHMARSRSEQPPDPFMTENEAKKVQQAHMAANLGVLLSIILHQHRRR